MDPREQRSARILREKLFELASSRDIATVTAVELSEATGLARRTIYNHGDNPQELLFGYLSEGLTEIRDRGAREWGLHSPAESFSLGLHRVLQHIQNHRAIYTQAVSATSSPAWHHLLTQHFTVSLLVYIEAYSPQLPVDPGLSTPDAAAAADSIVASSIAHAMVGAIEAWLRLENHPDQEVCYRLIVALTPTWFFSSAA